jgi:hypothetical protein
MQWDGNECVKNYGNENTMATIRSTEYDGTIRTANTPTTNMT